MDRLLFVVSQERRDLYEALRNVLAGETGVEVILDRRAVSRRQSDVRPAAERRRFTRRARSLESAEVRVRGWTVVRLP